MFEKVIQEVCDSSQVDFEESGVDQKTLHDLRDVSLSSFILIVWALMAACWVRAGRRKAGEPEVRGRRCLWGNTGI